MLVEIAIGDAYGAGFEFADPGPGRENDLTAHRKHALHDMPPGSYTDDTQMTVAVAEAMLAAGGGPTREALADAFVGTFRRDQRLGYARGFRDLLTEIRDGAGLLARMRPASERSGAAMRACPVGLLPDEDAVMALAETQARITHDTGRGVEAAQAVALATHYFRHSVGPKDGLAPYLADRLGGFWAEPHVGYVGDLGVDAARAAVTAVAASSSRSELLVRCVAFTGDVDTVAAVAMGAASFSPEIAADVPAVLVDTLENGPYGRDFLARLDARLLDAFPARSAPGCGR